jgi:polysaccharide export outer membrane protein
MRRLVPIIQPPRCLEPAHAIVLTLWLVALLPLRLHGAEPVPPGLSPPAPAARQPAPADAVIGELPPARSADDHRLAPGDRVSFRVVEDKTEPKSLLVADSGELEVPYIGRIMAKERTCPELAREIKQKLEAKYFHQATVGLSVELFSPVRGSVYLFGEVRSAGAQFLPSGETLTLVKAIIRAGGFTEFADKRRVKVTRETVFGAGTTNLTFTIDVGREIRHGQLRQDLKLEPGDVIYVPERLVNF